MYQIGIEYNAEQLIFIDEIYKDERSISRLYSYSNVNNRANKKVVFIRGKCYIILLALTIDGFIAAKIMEGSCDKDKFRTFIITQVVIIYLIIFLLLFKILYNTKLLLICFKLL